MRDCWVMGRRILIAAVVAFCLGLIVWSGLWNHGMENRGAQGPAAAANAAPIDMTPVIEEGEPASPLEGRMAPDFSLRDLSGQKVTLAGLRGKVVLINFWATWCAPCRMEMPWFIDLQRRYGPEGFTVVGIDKDYPQDLGKVPGFAREMRLNYPVVYGDGRTYADYGCCDYLPMSYYVDRDGMVRDTTTGLGSREEMEARVQALLLHGDNAPGAATTVAAMAAKAER